MDMREEDARKEYTSLLKLCGMGYYKKIDAGKSVPDIPEDLLGRLDRARENWIKIKAVKV